MVRYENANLITSSRRPRWKLLVDISLLSNSFAELDSKWTSNLVRHVRLGLSLDLNSERMLMLLCLRGSDSVLELEPRSSFFAPPSR